MNDLLVPTLFTLVMVVFGLLAWIGIQRLPRHEPTETELALERLRLALEETQAEIGRALLPVLEETVAALAELFPPKPTLADRVRRWFHR